MDVQRSTPTVNVSERERDVLTAVGEHLTNAEVAERLVISVRTVESHVSSLLRKFGVRDRRALVGVAADLADGALRPGPRSRVGSLPAQLTPFVGRVAERAALAAALADRRLVTAVGAGGIGKTRLAATVAGDVADRFAGGVWYVDLVPVADEAMTAAAVAGVAGLGEQPGRSAEQSVAAWLADREALLVLDNCEHLADGVVVLVERLLVACPRLRVLATSRARLLVPHEQVFPVPGLAVHDDGGDAVELFLDRAAAAGVPATDLDRRRVAALCRGLDGVALAIELAAARLPALGLGGLEEGLEDRLGLLAGGRRLDDRHRSLRSALDWMMVTATPAAAVVVYLVVPSEALTARSICPDGSVVIAGSVPIAAVSGGVRRRARGVDGVDQAVGILIGDPVAVRRAEDVRDGRAGPRGDRHAETAVPRGRVVGAEPPVLVDIGDRDTGRGQRGAGAARRVHRQPEIVHHAI